MEHTDHLHEYMKERVTRFVGSMGANTPDELRDFSQEALIRNLTEHAVPILRGIEDYAITSACYQLLTSIRWAKQNPSAGTYGRKPKEA